MKIPDDVLARVDADAARQGKNRTEWWVGLAVAVLDHRLVPAPKPTLFSDGKEKR